MNSRERYLATTHYAKRDHLFHWEMGPYEETLRRWHEQGLANNDNWYKYGGYDAFVVAPLNPGLIPGFEYKVLEQNDEYEIYQDGDGVIKKKIKGVIHPAMPQYLEYSLKGREQWADFKKRMNPDDSARFPENWETLKIDYSKRDYPLGINCGSLFGWLRNWMGVEGISYELYDDRAFIEQAAEEMTDSILAFLEKGLKDIEYDFALFWEDMAYKSASLISPKFYREIFTPQYRRITDRLHQAGIDIMMLDSDGNVEELIPIWLELGINFIYPMEVAAGMDVVAIRKKFGKELIIGGGMDKRVLASNKEAIKKMVDEKIPLMLEGGYVPGCDHAMPPDISWENYLYYRELLFNVKV